MTQQQRQTLIDLTVKYLRADNKLETCPIGPERDELEAKVQKLYNAQYQMRVELKANAVDILNAAFNIIQPGSGTFFCLGQEGLLL